MAILVAATGAALTWLAHAPAPERGARAPQPPAPPATVPPLDTANLRPAPGEPALPAAPPRDAAGPVTVDSGLAGAEPAEPAPPALTSPWRVLDADAYTLTPATVPLYARLPGAYEWPLPAIERLELICFHRPDEPAHRGGGAFMRGNLPGFTGPVWKSPERRAEATGAGRETPSASSTTAGARRSRSCRARAARPCGSP